MKEKREQVVSFFNVSANKQFSKVTSKIELFRVNPVRIITMLPTLIVSHQDSTWAAHSDEADQGGFGNFVL